MPLAIAALAFSMFAIGTTEFVIVGLLPTLSADLATTVPTTGLLVTAYALGIAVGGPIITAATVRIPRKLLLVALMAFFVVGNLLCGLATGFAVLLVARILTACTHAVFVGVGVVFAMNLVDRQRRARAVATVFGGLTIALVVGVPMGTFLGQHYSWRIPFFVVAALGLIAMAANIALLPSAADGIRPGRSRQLSALTNGRLLSALAVATLTFGGNILVYTYVAPLLEKVTGFPAADITWLLLAFGIAAAAANFAAGPLADRWPRPSLLWGIGALSAALLIMTVSAYSRLGTVITLIAWGGLGFGIAPILQTYTTTAAPRTPEIASSLTVSAFNLGIAGGAYVGGQVINTLGIHAVTWVGALAVAAALPLAALKQTQHPSAAVPAKAEPTTSPL